MATEYNGNYYDTSDDPHGWKSYWKLYDSGLWEPETKALIQSVLKPGDLFVDIGAWIGPTVLWALEAGADVIAIEPDPVALEGLYEIIGTNPKVEIWPGAVTVYSGGITLAVNPKEGGALGDSMSRIGFEGIFVPSWTLSQILGDRVPQLVKIDVEGYEIELLPAIMPWLAEHKVPMQISCHGTFPDHKLFSEYPYVIYPNDAWGDIQCLTD
jgi:FkbM family methyltransferase